MGQMMGPGVPGTGDEGGGPGPDEVVGPAKILRIGTMTRQLLEEIRQAPLDEASRGRLREMYDLSISELSEGLSDGLREELDRVSAPFPPGEVPTEGQLRVAQAQLVGWLEGLFHGIQVTLLSQQIDARGQLEQLHQQERSSPGDDDRPAPGGYM